MQLSIFDLVPDPLPTQLRYPNPRKAQKLRELAASLQSQIDKKLDPAISHQRPTRRRAGILEVLYSFCYHRWQDEAINRVLADRTGDWYGKLERANLNSLDRIKRAITALQSLDSPAPEDPAIIQIRELERALIGRNIRGYFPTPRPICQRMVELAMLRNGMSVWEPSAGKGSIAEVIRETARVRLQQFSF